MSSSVPDIPGDPIPHNSDQGRWLRAHVASLCGLDHDRFPGAQPVSFGTKDLDRLENADFWVCEKSDGIRVLLLVCVIGTDQSVYLIDRKNSYSMLSGLFFPHHEDPRRPLGNTLIDGELVFDTDPRTKKQTLRFLAFDGLVVDNQNIMGRTLDKRYGRLKEWFYKPYAKMLHEYPNMAQSQPFEIRVKDIRLSYHVDQVFSVDFPNLQHGTDGLIYTCVTTPYTPGTDNNIMKWKPPSENSIDFKLVLRFPPSPTNSSAPNFRAKPLFLLQTWAGGDRYEQYDILHVSDEEWEEMKRIGEQFDDRIIEVHWDPQLGGWRYMRFRDDKPHANHKDVVENIIQSIIDGVEKPALLERSTNIRNAWKARASQPRPSQPPQAQGPGRPPPSAHPSLNSAPGDAQRRYGPLASPKFSRVSGPPMVAGMYR